MPRKAFCTISTPQRKYSFSSQRLKLVIILHCVEEVTEHTLKLEVLSAAARDLHYWEESSVSGPVTSPVAFSSTQGVDPSTFGELSKGQQILHSNCCVNYLGRIQVQQNLLQL